MNEKWTTVEVISVFNASLISRDEARTLLGLDQPATPATPAEPAAPVADPTPAAEVSAETPAQ